jgi:hypothetical protein
MRAETAAAYCDEVSVEAFLRRVGSDYPGARHMSGRGRVWLKSEIDAAIDRIAGQHPGNDQTRPQEAGVVDAAELL